MICAAVMLAACSSDDGGDGGGTAPEKARRTVMVYMAAENNLTGFTDSDINEMIRGSQSLPADVNLIVFTDATGRDGHPQIRKIAKGKATPDTGYNTGKDDFYSSDPQRMQEALSYMMARYPAGDYGLVLWGHAGGWLIERDSISGSKPHRAYGYDDGTDTPGSSGRKWMNIPTLAKVLEGLPERLSFIFADCCNFQCAEVAYELRGVADYIIGSPAEIPGIGAPYDKIVPLLADTSEEFYKPVVDAYFSQIWYGYSVPLSVIKTAEMENLAAATRAIMPALADAGPVCMEDSTYYYLGLRVPSGWLRVMPDINDVMRQNLKDSRAYAEWKAQLDRTVVYGRWTGQWITSNLLECEYGAGAYHTVFGDDAARYGGMSMFFPQREFDYFNTAYDYNRTISRMQWYYAAGVDYYYNNVIKEVQ